MTARISVIMPNLNMAAFVGHALDSIFNQSLAVHEVICVDTGSSDGSPDVILGHAGAGRIKLIRHGPAPPAEARNVALQKAEGDVIAFLDADDLWPAGKLQRQMVRLFGLPGVEMVSGQVCYFDRAADNGLSPAADARTETIFHVHLGACIYKRAFLESIGLFDTSLQFAEDVDLMLRARESGRDFTILRSTELYYRRHDGSMTARDEGRMAQCFRLAAHKSLMRRRAAGRLGIALKDFSSYLEPS
jgi:glycosyltransferase involved in cell wall biosynthesis